MGVAARTTTYKFYTEDFVRKLKTYSYDFKDIDIFNFIKNVSRTNNFREFGVPLPVNKHCRFMGVFKGVLPRRVDNNVYEPSLHAYREIHQKYDVSNELLNSVTPGSFNYSYENLITMATVDGCKYSIDDMLKGVFSRRHIDFKIPRLNYWSINCINGILIKGTAFSGLITSKLFNSKRRNTIGPMKSYCIEYFNNIISKKVGIIDDSFVCVGGREKKVSVTEKFKIAKTRIVLMMEDVPTLLGQVVAVPITRAFQRLNDGFSFIGRSLEQRNYVDVANNLDCDLIDTVTFCADFSGHDNHVSRNQIIFAFSILRLVFPVGWKFMDKLFYYNMSSMVNKNVVVPNSNFVYKITKGIATGHPFTSLVNTLCAYSVFATAINKVSTEEEINKTRLYVAGDDVIGIVPISILDKLSHELTNNSGMKIDLLSDHAGPLYSNNVDFQVSFLKKKFTHMGMAWNDVELYSNLIHSNSGLKDSLPEIDRIINMLMNGPCDFLTNIMVEKIIKRHFDKPIFQRFSKKNTYLCPVHLSAYLNDPPNTKLLDSLWDAKFWYDDYALKHNLRKFRNYMRLGFRWFNTGQPFPGLGYKDDSYWIDATKIFIPAENKPFRYLLTGYLREQHCVEW